MNVRVCVRVEVLVCVCVCVCVCKCACVCVSVGVRVSVSVWKCVFLRMFIIICILFNVIFSDTVDNYISMFFANSVKADNYCR